MAGKYKNKAMREELFVASYLVDHNATKAARAAGFPVKYANCRGWEMLQRESVREAIDKVTAARVKRLDLKADDALLELHRMAFVNVAELCNEDWSPKAKKDLTEDQQRGLIGIKVRKTVHPDGSATVEVEFKTAKEGKLTETLKHRGLLKDNVVHSGDASFADLILAAQRSRDDAKRARAAKP